MAHESPTVIPCGPSEYNRIARFEQPISSNLASWGGFALTHLTLKRVDTFRGNVWVVVHLAVGRARILLVNRAEHHSADPKDASKAHFWFINILQFSFGGLLSTFLVFYFRSGTLWVSVWPLFLIPSGGVRGKRKTQATVRAPWISRSASFISRCSAFDDFILPVVLHVMGPLDFPP